MLFLLCKTKQDKRLEVKISLGMEELSFSEDNIGLTIWDIHSLEGSAFLFSFIYVLIQRFMAEPVRCSCQH